MTRPPPPLQQHLLTRSDLARMAVPATTVFRWLAAGSVEQIGDLPVAGAAKDPVFTVLHEPLRAELAGQLAGIGKPTVVMTPLGVRSFLLRALLRQREAGAEQTAAEAPEQVANDVAAALDASMPTDELATVLEHLVEEAAGDAVAMQHLAEQAVAAERAQATPPAEDVLAEAEGVEAADSEEAACFDFADLADEIESWRETEPTTDEHGSDGEHKMKVDTELANEAGMERTAGEALSFLDDAAAESSSVEAAGGLEADAAQQTEGEHEAVAAGDEAERTAEEALSFLDADEAANDAIEHAGDDKGGEHEAEVEHEAIVVPDEAERTAKEALSFLDTDEAANDAIEHAGDEEGGEAPAETDAPSADEPASVAAPPPTDEPASEEKPAAAAVPADDESLTAAEVAAFDDDDASVETSHAQQPIEEAPAPSAAATTSVAAPVAAEGPIAREAMAQVESFLGELKSTLVELAGRESKPIDLQPIVQPLVEAVQSNTALTEVQTQALQAMQQSLATLAERRQAAAAASPPASLAAVVAAPPDRSAMVMPTVAALVSCWAVVFWFTTGSKQLALGTLIGANALACCLLMARRRND
jgi:hypothetical protein